MIDENKLIKKIKEYHSKLNPKYISKLVDAEILDVIDIINEQPKVGEWISVKDRFPEDEGMYLVTSIVFDKTNVQYSFYQKNIEMFICNGHPIAWMPLPEPYKGDE